METVFSWRTEKIFRRPGTRALEKLAARAAVLAGSGLTENSKLCVTFLSGRAMIAANDELLGHSGMTDVICLDYRETEDKGFPLGGESAAVDLLICPAAALFQAEKRAIPYACELTLYLVHGLLHAAGLDDRAPALKRKMRRAERRVMKGLMSEFDLEKIFRVRDGEKSEALR